jgi:hypothetical protein
MTKKTTISGVERGGGSKPIARWSLLDKHDGEVPTPVIDPDDGQMSWEEAHNALVEALTKEAKEAQARQLRANDQLATVEKMDETAFFAVYGPRADTPMRRTVTIEYAIAGVGRIGIQASDVKDAVEQFARIDIRRLAGWCWFSSFDESGITVKSVDGEEIESDLWEVEKTMGLPRA